GGRGIVLVYVLERRGRRNRGDRSLTRGRTSDRRWNDRRVALSAHSAPRRELLEIRELQRRQVLRGRHHRAEVLERLLLLEMRFQLVKGQRHVLAALVPVPGILGHGAGDDLIELGRDVARELGRGREVLVDDLVGDRGGVVAREGLAIGQQLVEDDPGGEDGAAPCRR